MRNKQLIFLTGLVALLSVFAISCKKKTAKDVAIEPTTFNDRAFVQVYNGILNAARNYVYVDGTPVNGASIAYNATFPATPANFSVLNGYRNFLVKDTSSTTTQVPLSFAENLLSGNYYTIFLYDSLTTPKQAIVNNNIVIPSDTTARVRFANFIFSRVGINNVDVYSLKQNANIFTNVPVTTVTNYIPIASALNDTLSVLDAGTPNVLATLNGFNPTRKRSYTLVFRGRYQTTGTTGVARLLTAFASN
jgi:hypothetical protein